MKLLLISLFLVLTQISAWADNAGIIPRPLSVVKSEGYFTIDESTSLVFNKKLDKAASYLLAYLPLQTKKGKKNNSIRLTLDKKMAKEE